jgi:4-hydroxy-tetrahydrodipicolinate synthase
VISVASNVLPGAFRRLCDHARAARRADAEALDARMQAAYDFLGVEPNPIPVKALLAHFGIGHGLRLPLLPLSATHHETAARVASDILAIEQSIRDALAA